MATSGPNQATTGSDGGETPVDPWSSPEQGVVDDGLVAAWDFSDGGALSQGLYSTGFGTFAGVLNTDQITLMTVDVKCGLFIGSADWTELRVFNNTTGKSWTIPLAITLPLDSTLSYQTASFNPTPIATMFGSDLHNGELQVALVFTNTGFFANEVQVDAVRITVTGAFVVSNTGRKQFIVRQAVSRASTY